MKKFHLRGFLMMGLVAGSLVSTAQLHPPKFPSPSGNPPDNFYKDYVGNQLFVSSPTSIAGPLVYTTSNDGTGSANAWGGFFTSPQLDKELVRPLPDSFGCTTPFTNSMAGKVALIRRGPLVGTSCEFGAKALAAEQAGAIACIIVNHSPGGPVGMGAGAVGGSVTIPVYMISMEDGDVIGNALNNSQTVLVSFANWGSGKTNDLAILSNGISLWHTFAAPKTQVVASNGNPSAYKGYDGAFMANFGTANETNVMLKSEVSFTPTGGSTQMISMDSVSFASFLSSDSILAIGMSSAYDVHPPAGQTGKYDVKYTLSSSSVDEFIGNNVASYSYHITDNIFSKSRYNFAKDEPIANIFYRTGGTNPFIAGNLYHVAIGGYGAWNCKLAVSKSGVSTLPGTDVQTLLFKWTDTLGGSDKLMQVGEMELVGAGFISLTSNDSSGKFFQVDFERVDQFGNPIGGVPELQANSMYYVAAVVPGDAFLGFDGIRNYYPRTYLRHYAPSNPTSEFHSVVFGGTLLDLQSANPGLTPAMFVFEGGQLTATEMVDSARFAQQKTGFVPSISLRTSLFPLGVQTVSQKDADIYLYPNPVQDHANVTFNLDKTSSRVTFTIVDFSGRTISKFEKENVSRQTVAIPVREIANGTYLMLISTGEKTTTRKFVVAH